MTNKREEIANKIYGIAERCAMNGGDPLEAIADWHTAEQRKLLESLRDEYLAKHKGYANIDTLDIIKAKLQELNK